MKKYAKKYFQLSTLSLIVIMFFFNCGSKNQIDIPADALLVDVRTAVEYSLGNVPNSINIPLSQIESNIDKFKGQENIVLFCRSGNRSGQAIKLLEQHGISNMINGGSWKNVKNSISH